MLRALPNLLRLARAGFVMAREGALRLADGIELPAFARTLITLGRLIEKRSAGDGAEGLARALQRLGPSYVKLGQFLATRPDVVGMRVAKDLERLHDRVEPFPQEIAEAAVAEALGAPVSSLFVEFGPALAAASIAQVHKAVVVDPDGTRRTVAVKVTRPGVARRFASDLRAFFAIARAIERSVPKARRLKPVMVVETLARSVSIEMDLRLEAAALSEIADNTRADPGFRVPAVDWDRTARAVLTIDWVDGVKLSDRAGLEAAGHDLPALGRHLMQTFLRHAMRDGFFHADMHPGNLFVDASGAIVAVDFGITGRLGKKERRFLAEILHGFIVRDYDRIAAVHFEAGYVPQDQSVEEFARALRAIGEPIHSRTADQISMARLLTLLFEVTEIFQMQTRPELLMLQKTMVVVEGVARSLDTRLDMWRTAEPVVREWIERNLGPLGIAEEAGAELRQLMRGIAAAPELLLRLERISVDLEEVVHGGLSYSDDSIQAIVKGVRSASLLSNIALIAIAVGVIVYLFR
ncbi:2-polyprenylphenol 6-hydroxylase [Chenggangzhangella methanolivorans]|uniref:2-polyprenylphenol 6-hydroxylase n=1 Tax=Chenggangzhangella methanolivorans TaxID=1437009 RepID=A0A9E6UJM9_9HYPH|nr:2-polyprenylphenol 6-hydroxylase [Chenggangzhangella methanolivorans]QZN98291.1 2-polyprenylphenol 6-hydroxylase [Chenggangzhangella methanolivorans]